MLERETYKSKQTRTRKNALKNMYRPVSLKGVSTDTY